MSHVLEEDNIYMNFNNKEESLLSTFSNIEELYLFNEYELKPYLLSNFSSVSSSIQDTISKSYDGIKDFASKSYSGGLGLFDDAKKTVTNWKETENPAYNALIGGATGLGLGALYGAFKKKKKEKSRTGEVLKYALLGGGLGGAAGYGYKAIDNKIKGNRAENELKVLNQHKKEVDALNKKYIKAIETGDWLEANRIKIALEEIHGEDIFVGGQFDDKTSNRLVGGKDSSPVENILALNEEIRKNEGLGLDTKDLNVQKRGHLARRVIKQHGITPKEFMSMPLSKKQELIDNYERSLYEVKNRAELGRQDHEKYLKDKEEYEDRSWLDSLLDWNAKEPVSSKYTGGLDEKSIMNLNDTQINSIMFDGSIPYDQRIEILHRWKNSKK